MAVVVDSVVVVASGDVVGLMEDSEEDEEEVDPTASREGSNCYSQMNCACTLYTTSDMMQQQLWL